MFRAFAFAASACSLALGAAPTAADSVADFYKGKTVSLIIGYSAGGGADLWARFIARHLGRHIPGNPNVIVQNMPGGSGLNGREPRLQHRPPGQGAYHPSIGDGAHRRSDGHAERSLGHT